MWTRNEPVHLFREHITSSYRVRGRPRDTRHWRLRMAGSRSLLLLCYLSLHFTFRDRQRSSSWLSDAITVIRELDSHRRSLIHPSDGKASKQTQRASRSFDSLGSSVSRLGDILNQSLVIEGYISTFFYSRRDYGGIKSFLMAK